MFGPLTRLRSAEAAAVYIFVLRFHRSWRASTGGTASLICLASEMGTDVGPAAATCLSTAVHPKKSNTTAADENGACGRAPLTRSRASLRDGSSRDRVAREHAECLVSFLPRSV